MKVLYINPFDYTGYGEAGVRYVRAMRAAGVEVACRRLDFGKELHEDPLVRELLAAPLDGVTHCVQHTLPTHYAYRAGMVNIGLFANETRLVPPEWMRRLRWMDGVVCICADQFQSLLGQLGQPGQPSKRVAVIGHPCDTEKYQKHYPILEELSAYLERGYYIFYGVGEFVRRKNWATAIRAYFSQFTRADRVLFILKSGVPGLDAQAARTRIEKFVEELYVGMKLGHPSRRPPVWVLTEKWPEEKIFRLHASCDCYVSTSHGEAWNLPGMDAVGLGRRLIVPQWGGFCEYADTSALWLPVLWDQCFGAVESPAETYGSDNLWGTVFVDDVAERMHRAYYHGEFVPANLSKFCYQSVGAQFKQFLAGEGG